MRIDKNLAIKILQYLDRNKTFYFPFNIVCREYLDEEGDYISLEPKMWQGLKKNRKYKNFELEENIQDLRKDTTELLAKGFIEFITKDSLEAHIKALIKNYRKEYKKRFSESEDIEEYGINEFVGGKADAYEDCLYLIKKYHNFSS